MSDSERRVWLETYCEDLGAYSDEEIGVACKRYRQDGANRYFPTPGALLALMKNAYADPPTARRGEDWHTRLGFGGGACTCPRCAGKTRRDGFFVAPKEDYEAAAKVRAELAYDTERMIAAFGPSRLTDEEMHTRGVMVQDLVRHHGMEWEAARRKVMVERTKALYPEFRIWPALGNETDDSVSP